MASTPSASVSAGSPSRRACDIQRALLRHHPQIVHFSGHGNARDGILVEDAAAHSAPVALRDGILYVRVLQPSLHYELERIAKTEILRKLKLRFGGKPGATATAQARRSFALPPLSLRGHLH